MKPDQQVVNGQLNQAYVEPVAVGDPFPSQPIFLDDRTYVPAPLESTCQLAWSKCPAIIRELIDQPAM